MGKVTSLHNCMHCDIDQHLSLYTSAYLSNEATTYGDKMSKKVKLQAFSDGDLHEKTPLLGESLSPSSSCSSPSRSSLVGPAIDDEDVVLTNSAGTFASDTSAYQRKKDAAGGALGRLESDRDFEESVLDDSWVTIDQHRREVHPTTDLETFMHLLKGNIGPGLLALPLAVKNAGAILGAVGFLLMGIITTHCMLLLIDCAVYFYKKYNIQSLNYAEVASFAAVERFGERKQIYGKIASYMVNFFLIITQFGFCAIYFVFIADHLNQVMCGAFGIELSTQIWILIILVPIIVSSWIRNLDELAPLSLVANVCILLSLIIITVEEFMRFFSHNVNNQAPFRDELNPVPLQLATFTTLPLFFGTVVYSFEGIGIVLPMENKMKHPEHARRVILSVTIIVVSLFLVFAVLGYLAYGEEIESSITLNLTGYSAATCVVFLLAKLFYTFAVFASFMLQFYVPMDFLEPPLYRKLKLDKLMYYFPRHHQKLHTLIQLTFRTILVIFLAVLALVIPDLGDLISLVGAFASGALALIFPPLLEILVFWRESDRKFLWIFPRAVWLTKDILILILGVAGFLFGTFASVKNIAENFGNTDSTPDCQCVW